MERFDEGNTTLAICPVSSSSPSNTNCLQLNIQSQNSGMMIESRVPKGKVILEDSSDYLKVNLQDYFTGTNTSFGIVGSKTSKELKCRFSRDNLLKFVIDSVSDVNIIKHTFIIRDIYMVLIYEYSSDLQVYKIDDFEVKKINKKYDIDKLFNFCIIQFAKYFQVDGFMEPLIGVQCWNVSENINAAYYIQIYSIQFDNKDDIILRLIYTFQLDRILDDLFIFKSIIEINSYYLLGITRYKLNYDSILYLIKLNCTNVPKDFETDNFQQSSNQNNGLDANTNGLCIITDMTTFSGSSLNIDQFVVNSVMFISNHSMFVASVDNFGFIIFDLISKSVVDTVCLNSIIENFPEEFSIFKLIPIHNNGMRVIIQGNGAFTFNWRSIGKIQLKEKVFQGVDVSEISVLKNGEWYSNVVDYQNNGYSYIIYYDSHEYEFNDAFIEIFLYFNHANSKKFKELRIGKVKNCISIYLQILKKRVITICDDMIYVNYIDVNPSLVIFQPTQGTYNLNIFSQNPNSLQSINLVVESQNLKYIMPRWIVFIIFLLLVVIFIVIFTFLCDKTILINERDKISSVAKSNSTSNKLNDLNLLNKCDNSLRPTANFKNVDGSTTMSKSLLIFSHNKSINESSEEANLMNRSIRKKRNKNRKSSLISFKANNHEKIDISRKEISKHELRPLLNASLSSEQ